MTGGTVTTGEEGGWWRAVRALAGRPDLWPAAAALVPPRWWRRWPPQPVPPADYRAFRAESMYGDTRAVPRPGDLLDYLEWCRSMRRRTR
jgi:hypothetical protein